MGESEATDPRTAEKPRPRCAHLRSSGMYIRDDGAGEQESDDDDDDFGAYWCSQTSKSFGPDGCLVGGSACREPSRSCYEPI